MRIKRQFAVRKDDLVVAEIDAKVGGMAVVPPALDGAIVSSHYFTLELDLDRVLPGWVSLLCESNHFTRQVRAVGSTNYAAVRPAQVLAYRLPLPPLVEQRRIVDLMLAVDEARSGQRLATACSAVATGLLREIEMGAETWSPLADVVRVAKSGATPSRAKPDYWGDPIPWLKSGEVDADHIRTTSEAITELGLAETSAWIMPVGTVVVAMYGQGLTAGSVGYVDAPMCANQAVLGLVPDDRLVHGRFLFHWLRGRKEAMRERRTGSSQPNLNKKLVLREPVPVLDLQRQRGFADILDDLSATALAARTLDDMLVRLRSALLDALLSGEHEIPASYDRFLNGAA